jgi:hypothetical protein
MVTAPNQRSGADSSPSTPRDRRGSDRGRVANARTTLLPERGSRRHHGFGFWAVALTFLALAAFTTVPSPLYGLYQARDGFSEFMLTVIFAAYAVGVIGALAVAGHLSDWHERRPPRRGEGVVAMSPTPRTVGEGSASGPTTRVRPAGRI